MLGWYRARLARRPVLTQSITTAVLFATGDALAQHGVEKKGLSNHDYGRSGRMMLYGGAIFGPVATKWYSILQHRINFRNHNVTLAARVLADQTVFATANLFCFLSSMAIMEGTSPRDKLASSYLPGLKANWMLWPSVQAINFKLVPLEHRVLVVNVIALGWNCYLSYLNNQS